MGFLSDLRRALKATKRPEAKVYRASLRVVALSLFALGALGYVFQLAGSALRMAQISPPSTDVLVVVMAALAAIVLAAVLYLRTRY